MMTKIRSTYVLYFGSVLMTLASGLAHAELISVQFSGTIFVAQDTDGFLTSAGVVNGDLVDGQFSYDTASAPWGNPSPARSQYWPIDYSFTIGENKVSFDWTSGGSGIVINDNFSNLGDMFTTSLSGNLVNTATQATHNISTTNSWVANSTGAAWVGSALPTYAVLTNFINPTNQGYQSFSRMQGTNLDYSVRNFTMQAQLIEPPTAAAPIPATLPLLGLGLAALGFSRRKRKLHS